MDGYLRSRQRRDLLGHLGIDTVYATEMLSCRRLSQVDRLHLPDQRTVIYKTVLPLFTREHTVLRAARESGMPVPEVLAAQEENGMLGMLLTDLGAPARAAEPEDVVRAAAQLHSTPTTAGLRVFDTAMLASLPRASLDLLGKIQAGPRGQRYAAAGHVHRYLWDLVEVARVRAEGAELAPFGLVHGEMYRSAVHIGADERVHILDFTMAHSGPGLLDLVPLSGVRDPADAAATSELIGLYTSTGGPPSVLTDTRKRIELYVSAGGPSEALADRGGLPAEAWALGWHRIRAAHWLLSCTDAGINAPAADEQHLHLLGCLLACAWTLFCR
ncbi:MAG: hypothetical protein QOF58_280 [Pseudonocardiales bacterium]|jgi:aminoglycoside phosphotransferase (APT) family kinase protein|nr:hypothetical protein [Pseudonocardiales bacterium]